MITLIIFNCCRKDQIFKEIEIIKIINWNRDCYQYQIGYDKTKYDQNDHNQIDQNQSNHDQSDKSGCGKNQSDHY